VRNYCDWKSIAILGCLLTIVPVGANGDIPPLDPVSDVTAYSASETFTPADVGKVGHMQFAGTATGCGTLICSLLTTTAGFADSSTVTLAVSANNTATNQILRWGTKNAAAVQFQDATTSQRNPLLWDENSDAGCNSTHCPPLASENTVGTIPSEAFAITDKNSSHQATPEPCSMLLLGSGILCLAGAVRRKLL